MLPLFPCVWRGIAVMALLAALCIVTVPHAITITTATPQCAWVFSVKEGETQSSALYRQWDRSDCPVGEYVSVRAKSGAKALPGFSVPSAHLPVVQFTPQLSGLASGEVRYETQEISVTCNMFTPLCEEAAVYYVIHGVGAPAVSTTTTTTTTKAPHSTADSVQCPVGNLLPQVDAIVSLPQRIDTFPESLHCASPRRVVITSSTGKAADGSEVSQTLFSVDDGYLWFDQAGVNTMEGVFTASLTIYCSDVLACTNVNVRVVAVRQSLAPSPAPSPPNCTESYGFRASFGQTTRYVIQPRSADACPSGVANAFRLVTPPRYDSAALAIHPVTGALDYNAPPGPQVTSDAFTFLISCGSGETALPLCVGHVTILVTAAPPPAPTPTETPKEVKCPGDFFYSYDIPLDGSFTPRLSNLFSRVSMSNDFCPSGAYSAAELRAPAVAIGAIASLNSETGAFVYTPAKDAGKSSDAVTERFGFALTCAASGAVCYNVATVRTQTLLPEPTGRPLYQLGRIVCRGTCDASAWCSSPMYPNIFDTTEWPSGGGRRAHVTPRRDEKSPDEMDFFVMTDGLSLRIRAYTSIGSMATRFVTFAPIQGEGKKSPLTSSVFPHNAHTSFDTECLDRQAKDGLASLVWTWDDEASLSGQINKEAKRYKSGENYFQKFGGKHIDCDVFREDSCKYAPMLSPSGPKTSEDVGIDWKLYINDCDATWVGTISLEKLRRLQDSNGAPIFTLVNESTLVGSLYTQVVKPATWWPPYKGILTSEKRYTVRLSLMNSVVADVAITPTPTPDGNSFLSGQKSDGSKEEKLLVQDKALPMKHAASAEVVEKRVIQEEASLVGNSDSIKLPFNVSVDVRFATKIDPLTQERLFLYTLQLYPFYVNYSNIMYSVPEIVYVNATQLRVTNVTVLNASWTSPDSTDCPQCIGKDTTCDGTGNGFELRCSNPIISFEPAGPANLVSSPSSDSNNSHVGNHVNISIVGRVRGKGTMETGDPQGSFAIAVRFAGGQEFVLNVQQHAYIGGINTFVDSNICRSSAYWPVPDPFGRSIPTMPFDVTEALLSITSNVTTEEAVKAVYGPPIPLHNLDTCAAWAEPQRPPFINLNETTALLHDANIGTGDRIGTPVHVALCAVPNENIYGVTDWVYVSLSGVHAALRDSADPAAELLSLVLSVEASEVLGAFPELMTHTQYTKDTGAEAPRLYFLLDGTTRPRGIVPEEQRWMTGASENAAAGEVTYLAWEKYAAFLHYRRMHVRSCRHGVPNMKSPTCVMEPFHFAFVPGALLHQRSSRRVVFELLATMKFPPSAPGEKPQVKELLYSIPVSSQISSAVRFDRDAYTLPIVPLIGVTHRSKSSTFLLIVLVFLFLAVVGATIYLEMYYKRFLRSAKRRLRQQLAKGDAASVDGLKRFADESPAGMHFSPMREKTTKTTTATAAVAAPAEGSVTTQFGVVHAEPPRVRDTESTAAETFGPQSVLTVCVEQRPREEAKEEEAEDMI